MDARAVHERLRHARIARGEELAGLACRIGVRQEHLRAIEDGRFGDLPTGIYGRAAVRTFAAACGFDPAATLAECAPLLPVADEPIEALARLRGVRPARHEPHHEPINFDRPSWRPLAASAVDALVVVALLVIVVVATASLLLVPIAALHSSAVTLALVGLLLGAGYFVWFGGLGGATIGERLAHVVPDASDPALLTLRSIAERTLRSATVDVRCIVRLGVWLASRLDAYRSQAA